MISREIPPMYIVVNVKAAKLAKVITVNIKSLDNTDYYDINADYYDIPLTI
jgi:hypothetical protein